MKLHMMNRLFLLFVTVFFYLGTSASATLYGIGNGINDNSSNLFIIDDYSSTPVAIDIGETGKRLFGIAVNPTSGLAYGITTSKLYSVDLGSAAATYIGTMDTGTMNALEFSSDGRLYTWGYGNTKLYEVDPSTGALAFVMDTGFNSWGDMAFDANGMLYGSSNDDNLIRIDIENATVDVVGIMGASQIVGLDFDVDGRLYGIHGTDSTGVSDLYAIDHLTAATTYIGTVQGASGFGMYGMSFDSYPTPVPEPTTLFFLGTGLIGFAGMRRKFKN